MDDTLSHDRQKETIEAKARRNGAQRLCRAAAQVNMTHDEQAPFWAAALIILCATGLATVFIDGGAFWNGYVLDMTGPAWNYILFRGRFTAKHDNLWTRTFTPVNTFAIFLAVCAGIEFAQYLELYEATYDPWDFLAYLSLLGPLFILDYKLSE